MSALSKRDLAALDAGQLPLFQVADGFVTKEEALRFVGAAPPPPPPPLDTRAQSPDVHEWLDGMKAAAEAGVDPFHDEPGWPDFADLSGNEVAKRALEIAAVARHTILLVGPEAVAEQLIEASCGLAMMSAAHGEPGWNAPNCELWAEVSEPRECDRFPQEDTSAKIRARVDIARKRRESINPASLEEPAKKLLTDASVTWQLDREAVKRVLSVARSIAALASADRIARIHIAEALSYARPIEPPEPGPAQSPLGDGEDGSPEPVKEDPLAQFYANITRDREVVEVDPKRVAWGRSEGQEGDIRASYSADTLANHKGGNIRKPFKFRGGEWVSTGGGNWCECYRVVPAEAFDGPTASYRDHDFGGEHRARLGGYHGMRAKHGSRDIVLQGPPIIVVAGKPAQETLL